MREEARIERGVTRGLRGSWAARAGVVLGAAWAGAPALAAPVPQGAFEEPPCDFGRVYVNGPTSVCEDLDATAQGASAAGWIGAPTGGSDGWVARLGPSGDPLWERRLDLNDSSTWAVRCEQDGIGGVYVGGFTQTTDSTSSGCWVARLDPAGSLLWSRLVDVPSGLVDDPRHMGIERTPDGGVMLISHVWVFDSSLMLDERVRVDRFDGAGGLVWSKSFGHASFSFGYFVDVDSVRRTASSGSRLFVATRSTYVDEVTFEIRNETGLHCIDDSGAQLWAVRLPLAEVTGLTSNGSGGVHLSQRKPGADTLWSIGPGGGELWSLDLPHGDIEAIGATLDGGVAVMNHGGKWVRFDQDGRPIAATDAIYAADMNPRFVETDGAGGFWVGGFFSGAQIWNASFAAVAWRVDSHGLPCSSTTGPPVAIAPGKAQPSPGPGGVTPFDPNVTDLRSAAVAGVIAVLPTGSTVHAFE